MLATRHSSIFTCVLVLAAVALGKENQPAFDDSTVRGLVAHGQSLAENGDHAAAIEKYDKAIARDPASADAHAWKAASLISLNRLDDADAQIQQAIKQNGDEFTYQMIAGRLEIARGNIDAGSALYDRAAKASPRDAGKVYADLAAALVERKDEKLTGQIESALKSATSANPPHLDALFNLGQSYVSAGKPEGRDYLKRYLDAQAKLPDDQRDKQKMQLARKMIRAVDILNQVR
ncbi:MAG TPA: tetratricopeptide repeat protein [Tepidisphaeraceae bacterium]|jgi:tetratricopeptide (TPR) repeat protein|nr:tetratricopeptide repeat protein [Tepidisphaeraceae bacterium]